jgi:hypothetical protein
MPASFASARVLRRLGAETVVRGCDWKGLYSSSATCREPLPGLTYGESERLLRTGMASVTRVSSDDASVAPPYPEHRIVWHVTQTGGRGTSRLAVNIFIGSVPVAYVQQLIDNSAPMGALTSAIASLTNRLITQYAEHDLLAKARSADGGEHES